jgi:hypothetical protein
MRMLLVLVGSFLILAGCQHFGRTRQCRALADGVNPELMEISSIFSKRSPTTATEFHDLARRYSAVALRIQKLRLTEPELIRITQALGVNLQNVSRSCDQLASLFRHPETSAAQAAAHELESLRQAHLTTVSMIDKFCQE